jgi:hypothetical protein
MTKYEADMDPNFGRCGGSYIVPVVALMLPPIEPPQPFIYGCKEDAK